MHVVQLYHPLRTYQLVRESKLYLECEVEEFALDKGLILICTERERIKEQSYHEMKHDGQEFHGEISLNLESFESSQFAMDVI